MGRSSTKSVEFFCCLQVQDEALICSKNLSLFPHPDPENTEQRNHRGSGHQAEPVILLTGGTWHTGIANSKPNTQPSIWGTVLARGGENPSNTKIDLFTPLGSKEREDR